MAVADILLESGDSLLQLELLEGTLNSPHDIMSDKPGVYERPYVTPTFTGVDILDSYWKVDEISHDGAQIFITDDGRVAIRLDKQLIKVLD